ncbi:MAG: HAD-IA family hydrolase, partial [Candidatus Nanohaloarchaea archaeon]|nr:HAD-IA family hydrolase [Candidatus Nanohaloarchaea archaeon]
EYRFAELKRENMEDGLKGLYDDVETVKGLAGELKLGIVSNNQHRTIEHIVSIFDLDEVFDTYYGKEPGMEGFDRMKPDPHYLDAAMEDLDAEEVLYVGDSWFDVAAARNAGVDVTYIEREHNADREPEMEPDYRISSLEELPELLEED